MPPRRTGRMAPHASVKIDRSALKTSTYNLPNLHNHWSELSRQFSAEYSNWITTFDQVINLASRVGHRLEHRRKLSENCTYLLLTKALNHSMAAYALLEKGLVVDAALSTRNAIETLLMLELFVTDDTNEYFESWAGEKEFSPGEVRKKLINLQEVTVGDVVFHFTDRHYEGAKELYGFLSKITHANLASLRHVVVKETEHDFKVFMGGSLEGQSALVHMVFRVLCDQIMSTIRMCAVIFDLSFFETTKSEFEVLSKKIKPIAVIIKDQS